jgi:16S rRNA processing protein RimM
VARLLRPQGRKGELLADLLTDFPERFTGQPRVFLAKPGFAGEASSAIAADVTDFWLPTGKNLGRIVLAFQGISSINDAERLSGLDVLIPTADRIELEPGAEYIDDLVGCIVFDGQSQIGTLESLEFSTDPAGRRLEDVAPLLTVVTAEGDEVLIPYAQDFLVSVDIAARRIEMKLPAGLLDLNRPQPKL